MSGTRDGAQVEEGTRPVGLGAICDLADGSRFGGSQSFDVSEFIVLANGQRVLLHSDRGFTVGMGAAVRDRVAEVRDLVTEEDLVRSTLNTVLPDTDDSEPHPWTWLLELALSKGVMLSSAEIRELPYEVLLTQRVISWLTSSSSRRPT